MEENEHSHNEPSLSTHYLEYLDQFLQLKCAPDLIAMGLFPNSKEITETFAVWRALKGYILPLLSTSTSSIDKNRQNAIIVVGDGMTPRTAALCAFLTKGLWQCYSVDPILQYDTYADMSFISRRSVTTADHCEQWKTIKGLRMVRGKIQTLSIECRQAIIVMMHAHVTIEDSIAAIDASEGIVGLVTCPCCKWGPFQTEWLGQAPHHQYTDLRLLSAKNQMNVWCFPQGCDSKSSINLNNTTTTEDNQTLPERNIWGIETNMMENLLSTRDGVKQRAIELWPQIFSNGIKVFNNTDTNQSSSDLDTWPWSSTTWSPKDIASLMKSCTSTTPSSSTANASMLTSWFEKPVLLVGTIGAMRRCKNTIFYELNTCDVPSEQLQEILRLTSGTSSTTNTTEEKSYASNGTFPALLKSADRIWTCVEYQRHRQLIAAFDSTAERNIKKQNSQTKNVNDVTDRVNIILSLLPYKNSNISTIEPTTYASSQSEDPEKLKLFRNNPQPRLSLFPWAMSLRTGDILVAYCELGRNASQGPLLCLVDGILLFDSKLHMFGVDRRILR